MFAEDERFLMRMRSTKIVSADEDQGDFLEVNKVQKIRPDKPCHKMRDSLLSSSGNIDKTGFMNLFAILLMLTVANSALESILKYGILYKPLQCFGVFFYNPSKSPFCLILLGFNVFALSSFGVEVLLSKGLLSEKLGLTIITTLLTSEILIPSIILFHADCRVLAAAIAIICVIAVFLKLASYHMTNFWCREVHAVNQKVHQHRVSSGRGIDIGSGNIETNLVHYPDNLNLKDLYYFLCVPTLCYELNFPRSPRIRKTFLVKRVIEMMFLIEFITFLSQQCLVPTLNASLEHFQEMDYSRILEKLLKSVVPTTFIFLLAAYVFFHAFYNAGAEILRFGDRYFYDEFWNMERPVNFWQYWHIPVHNWCTRHLYSPLRNCGFTNFQSATAVFLISAIFHEFVFIVSLKMFTVWAVVIMLGNIPLFMLIDTCLRYRHGNIVWWTMFAFFIPFATLMYYYDYYIINLRNMEAAV